MLIVTMFKTNDSVSIRFNNPDDSFRLAYCNSGSNDTLHSTRLDSMECRHNTKTYVINMAIYYITAIIRCWQHYMLVYYIKNCLPCSCQNKSNKTLLGTSCWRCASNNVLITMNTGRVNWIWTKSSLSVNNSYIF